MFASFELKDVVSSFYHLLASHRSDSNICKDLQLLISPLLALYAYDGSKYKHIKFKNSFLLFSVSSPSSRWECQNTGWDFCDWYKSSAIQAWCYLLPCGGRTLDYFSSRSAGKFGFSCNIFICSNISYVDWSVALWSIKNNCLVWGKLLWILCIFMVGNGWCSCSSNLPQSSV